MYTFKSFILAVVAIVLLAFVPNVSAKSGNAYPYLGWNKDIVYKVKCGEFTHFEYHNVDLVSSCGEPAADNNESTSESTIESTIVPPVFNEPTVPEAPKDKKVHCNNGEGNGPEGCSPTKSENANNDENHTTPKEDKSNNVVTILTSVLFVTLKRGKREIGIANAESVRVEDDGKIVFMFSERQNYKDWKMAKSNRKWIISSCYKQISHFENDANDSILEKYFQS